MRLSLAEISYLQPRRGSNLIKAAAASNSCTASWYHVSYYLQSSLILTSYGTLLAVAWTQRCFEKSSAATGSNLHLTAQPHSGNQDCEHSAFDYSYSRIGPVPSHPKTSWRSVSTCVEISELHGLPHTGKIGLYKSSRGSLA